jgi:hypothetical protein
MTSMHRVVASLLVAIMLAPLPAIPQEASQGFKPEELDQLVAPIALHPDPLLAQILMASTYPLEIVQAARFVKDNAGLKGDQLNEALKQYTWDDSVKSLVFFPQVLTMLNDKLDWLQKLGDAFLGQQQELMAAVQRLRARARDAGQLKDTKEQKVIVEPASAQAAAPPTGAPPPPPPPPGTAPQAPPAAGAQLAPTTVQVQPSQTVIRIEPADPQVVYVPSYNPTVVYGAWPYPAYPPYYPYPPGYFAAGAFAFGAGLAVGGALWGDCDWDGGDVNINNSNANNFTNNVNNRDEARNRVEQRSGTGGPGTRGENRGQWKHNPEHRKGVQYRDSATQQRFNKSGPANAQSREAFRGRTQGSDVSRATQQGGAGQPGARDRQGGPGQQPGGGPGDRGTQASPRAGGLDRGGAGGGRQAGAFEGMGGGRDTQSFSNRGNASRESFSRSSGASRGGAGAAAGGRAGGGGRSGGGGGGGGGGGRGGGRR